MEYLVLAGTLFLFVVLIMVKGYLDSIQAGKRFVQRLYEHYGEDVLREYKAGEIEEHISMYYRKHQEPWQIDEITWHDLDLDEVYKRMNYAHSSAGDEYLYYRLRTPMQTKEEIQRFERHVEHFQTNEKERVALQVQFHKLGRMRKYSLYEYLDYLELLGERNNLKYYLSVGMVFVSIGLMFESVPVGLCVLLGVLCFNMIRYYKEQKEIEPYITSFRYIAKLIESAEKIGKQSVHEIAEERDELLANVKSMEQFKRNSFIVFSGSGAGPSSGDILGMFFDYVRMIFYLDLIKFNQMLRVVRSHPAEIDRMFTLIGEIETAVVTGEYRANLQGAYCIPEFVEENRGNACLCLRNMYHPLLKDPVKNDIEVKKGVLLTGSNASGKSTFLRAVAINAILAQTLHTCMADSYRGVMFRICSSMSLQDDIESGDSYYMVEVKSIRRILENVKEAAKEGKHVLCFVDEVLRGTNTVERIAASTQILKALSGDHVICFAATHDGELTRLLKAHYDNYHFEEEIAEDDIFFPYRIKSGPATSRNAIALLKMLGYDTDLVKDAESLAERFLQSGTWE